MEEEVLGIIKEVFPTDDEVINDLTETDVIESPDDDPTIPTEDQDTGDAGGDTSPITMDFGGLIEPDSTDVISEVEDIELYEPATVAEEEEEVPLITNVETLPTIGAVKQGERVMIALVNGEPMVIGTVGSGDSQQAMIDNAETMAQQAQEVAQATGQHFWTSTTGTDSGAHITQVSQEDWNNSESENYHSGPNSLWNSLGMLFRKGLTNLMSVLTNGIAIYDGNGNDSTNILAEFTANRIRLGKKPSATEPTYAKVEFFDGDTSLSSSIIPDSEIDGGRRSIFLANNYAVNNLDAYGYLGIAHQIGDDGTNTTENANTTIQAMTGDKNKYAGVSAISISNNGATPSTRVNLHADYVDLSDGANNKSFTMANVIEALESGGVGTASTSITLSNLGSGTKTMYLRRFGNIVVAQMNNTSQVAAANKAYTVGTVPAGYRPAQAAYCSGHCVSNNTIQGMFR